MKDLNRYVTRKYSADWYDIGIELELETSALDTIQDNNRQQNATCLQRTLDKWLKLNKGDTTWRTLEVALTNVNRAKLGLNPVDDVHDNGKSVIYVSCCFIIVSFFCFVGIPLLLHNTCNT